MHISVIDVVFGLVLLFMVYVVVRGMRLQKQYTELLRQQVVVLSQTNELLKKITESR